MNDLIIIGAGGCGREVLQWAMDINADHSTWNILGFLDDTKTGPVTNDEKYGVIGTPKEWEPTANQEFVCAIGAPCTKEMVVRSFKERQAKFATIIHPMAYVGKSNHIGEGFIAYPGTHITADAYVGDFVTVITSGIGHDAVIGDYCTISAYCDITGGVQLGERVFLGSHVTIVPGRKIGPDAYLCAGAVIMSDVKENAKMFGNPAKRVSF